MISFVAAPFAVAILLSLTTTYLVAHLPPAAATRLLCVGALSVSLTCGMMLCGIAILGVSRLQPVAEVGLWSTAMPGNEVGPTLGIIAGVVAAMLLVSAFARTMGALRVARQARAVALGLPGPVGKLVVVDVREPIAHAIASAGGRIVVSKAMLQALTPAERRVVLAHEDAHLRHRHHLYVVSAEIAAAANPLLRPVTRAVRQTVERWADEVAALVVDDRTLVAHSVAKAALVRARFRAMDCGIGRASAGLAVDAGNIPQRVEALLAPPRAGGMRLGALLIAGSGVCWLAVAVIACWTHTTLEVAQSALNH